MIYHCHEIISRFVIAQVAIMGTTNKELFTKIKFFIQEYSVYIKIIRALNEEKTCDILKSEFCSLQQDEISSDILNENRACIQWHLIGQLKNSEGSYEYKNMSDVILLILTIFQ